MVFVIIFVGTESKNASRETSI